MELDDHFEDFTTASEWETFIARLEQLLSEDMAKPWESSDITNDWVTHHDKLSFADFPFKLSYYKRVNNEDMTSSSGGADLLEGEIKLPTFLSEITKTDSEFPPRNVPHIISDYFNLSEFAVLSSAGLEPVNKETKLKMLLSSSCIAINNTNCSFPVFVQFHHWSQNYFCGISESSGVRTSFQMVMLQPNPNLPTYLSGLLDIFKSKFGSNLPCPVGISTHFFYKIKYWPSDINCDSYPPELFDLLKESIDSKNKEKTQNENFAQFEAHTAFLAFGSQEDPFLNMDLVAGWPFLTEDVVVDSSSYTDLEPENAQEWYFSLKSDPNAEFRLCAMVEGIWKLRKDTRTTEQILGKPIDKNADTQNFSSALDKIARSQVVPIPMGFNHVFDSARRRAYYNMDPNSYEDLAPLSKEHMDLLMNFLFPDAKQTPDYPYPTVFPQQDLRKFKKEFINASLPECFSGVKSAPVGSLVWRLSVITKYLLAYGDLGSSSAVAYLWAEMMMELRFRIDNSKEICGLEPGSPNIGTCLLNQKLQMLNCCIAKKLARTIKQNKSPEDALDSDLEESDDDEFFDCEDNMNDETEIQKLKKPSGRSRKNGKLRLIKSGEPMYIPETQDPAPLTEDVMEEQSQVMIELGNHAAGSELRAKMMSASLQSDMESFKAANPGALLEDFVRWYSPRDWIEIDETDQFENPVGELSPRMKLPGNLWLEVWSTAQAVPSRKQKRLFDDTKEAEKVLHWLNTRSLSDVSQLLLPCVMHVATFKILDEIDNIPFDYEVPSSLFQNVSQFTRCFSCVAQLDKSSDDMNSFKNLVMKDLLKCEKEITEIRSFHLKFPSENINEILSMSKDRPELFPNFIKVPNGKKSELGSRIFQLFVNSFDQENIVESSEQTSSTASKFGKPFRRVFILKYIPPTKVSDNSSTLCLPQRMSCLLKDDRMILAGTFSNKTYLV